MNEKLICLHVQTWDNILALSKLLKALFRCLLLFFQTLNQLSRRLFFQTAAELNPVIFYQADAFDYNIIYSPAAIDQFHFVVYWDFKGFPFDVGPDQGVFPIDNLFISINNFFVVVLTLNFIHIGIAEKSAEDICELFFLGA